MWPFVLRVRVIVWVHGYPIASTANCVSHSVRCCLTPLKGQNAGTSDYPNTGTRIWYLRTGNQRKNSQNGNGTILSLST